MSLSAPDLNNAAMAGCLGGMASGRQPIVDSAGTLMQPADFAAQVAVAETFAVQEQVALAASLDSPPAAVPPYIGADLGVGGVTTVVTTAATAKAANSHQTFPAALMVLTMASFDNQPVPSDATGLITDAYFAAQANAVSAVLINAVNNSGVAGPFFYTD